MTKLETKLVLDGNGSYLGMEKGCFVLKDKRGEVNRYPLFEQEIDEVILKSGNSISTGALASFGFWDIDVLVMTSKGRPVAMLKSLDSDNYVLTRVAQYKAYLDERAYGIAKNIVKAKMEGQNIILQKHGFEPHSSEYIEKIDKITGKNLEGFQRSINGVEGNFSQRYLGKMFSLIPENIRPEKRAGFMAYDGTNNVFNLAYEMLGWKVHKALLKAHLEPYLGFLHTSVQASTMSLVCDFQEIYRAYVDDFVIGYLQNVKKRDFITKTEIANKRRRSKREYLNDSDTREFMRGLNGFFETRVEVKRIRNGEHQTLETLINEEALLFAKYLRGENKNWVPRVTLHN
ncbi:CRISPR-associated endonuclease Cas1 [Candidatus Bathyarchaeota archaeon]|nr:CRISPR-associated endonuclease Cas1 [Candidatus Bathyarchaeota archaeon]